MLERRWKQIRVLLQAAIKQNTKVLTIPTDVTKNEYTTAAPPVCLSHMVCAACEAAYAILAS